MQYAIRCSLYNWGMNLNEIAELVYRYGSCRPNLLKSIRVLECGDPPEVFIAAARKEFNDPHPRLLYVKRQVHVSPGVYAFPIISDRGVIFPDYAKRFVSIFSAVMQ